MSRIILAPHWRTMSELFNDKDRDRLGAHDIIWGRDDPIPDQTLADALPQAEVLIAAMPVVSKATLDAAPKLTAVIEVSGSFPDTIDYDACAARGVEVLSCAPGFRSSVAEMGLAMVLAGARGLLREHEAFRGGTERWLEDCATTDFTLFGARVGFVGFGQIGQEMAQLMGPFAPQIRVHDPWLPPDIAAAHGVDLMGLQELATWAQVLIVAAVPTSENQGLIDAAVLAAMPDHAQLVVLSRAHLVDFEALMAEARSGRLHVALDVFPTEPLAPDHPIRSLPNVVLSPHRAAAVAGGRQLIGTMICDDLDAIAKGDGTRRLGRADAKTLHKLAGIGDAASVGQMASDRKT